jgi:hypothetical protein
VPGPLFLTFRIMEHMDPTIFAHYRAAVERDIRWAFRFVTRDDGVSWSESYVIDDRGGDKERAAARASDKDQHWSELIEDKNWEPERGLGGFCFLDQIGFRYYLPAAMVRNLQGDFGARSVDLEFHLRLPAEEDRRLRYEVRWQIFNDEQRAAIARYLLVEAMRETREGGPLDGIAWETLHSHWIKWLTA